MENNKKTENPIVFIIFGATGDLSKRHLLPAFFDLYLKNIFPAKFKIVGFAKRKLSDENFREIVKEVLKKEGDKEVKQKIDKFLNNIFYKQGIFENANSYLNLGNFLMEFDEDKGQCSNKLFYLATSSDFYDDIFENLANSGLSIPCAGDKGWTRILIEKPFGRDIKTAQKLDKKLGLLFKETQIFRIDHYMAKEAMQNILAFRFSNSLFEPIWNNKYIEKVEIKLFETLGIENRGIFYNGIGALRDMGQNHLLQMLSFVAMDNPEEFQVNKIRNKRIKVLKALRGIKKNDMIKYVKRGQYKDFKKEAYIDKNSETETYFKIEVYVDNKRWKGVPFYIESGKKMPEKKTEISVFFKEPIVCLCPIKKEKHHQNILSFKIQPDQGISIQFWAKRPGLSVDLEQKNLSFLYKSSFKEELLNAYQKVLFDAILGDQTLFSSTEEVKASWKFITPILKNWKKVKLNVY